MSSYHIGICGNINVFFWGLYIHSRKLKARLWLEILVHPKMLCHKQEFVSQTRVYGYASMMSLPEPRYKASSAQSLKPVSALRFWVRELDSQGRTMKATKSISIYSYWQRSVQQPEGVKEAGLTGIEPSKEAPGSKWENNQLALNS